MHNSMLTAATALSHAGAQVHVRVQIPTKVNGEEKKLIEELREVTASKAKAGKWFGKG